MGTNYSSKHEPLSGACEERPRNIAVKVVRDEQRGVFILVLDPPTIDIRENEQATWRTAEGRLEIRFNPNNTPFTGATFKTARGGTIFSGVPRRNTVRAVPYNYTLLVTTATGFFIKQDADLRVVDQTTPPRPPSTDPSSPHKGGLLCQLVQWLERLCCER